MPPLFPRIDDEITAPEVSLSTYDGKCLGRTPIAEACRIAREEGLALIEVYPDHEPPSCRLVPRWMLERVKHYFRGPAESLTDDLPPMGVAWLEFDEDGWNSRSVYMFGNRYYSSRGLQPMEHHPLLDEALLGDQPLWVGNFPPIRPIPGLVLDHAEEPDVVQTSSDEFESIWRIANAS